MVGLNSERARLDLEQYAVVLTRYVYLISKVSVVQLSRCGGT